MEYYDGEPLRHLGDLPAMGAYRYADKTAFEFYGQTLTYEELDDRARRAADALAREGVEPGDRVGLLVPNELTFPVAYFGAINAGGVAVPLNLRMDPETLVYVVQDAEIDCLVSSRNLAEQAEDLAEAAGVETLFTPGADDGPAIDWDEALEDADPDAERPEREFTDVAVQPYTSGTTGDPKGVLHTHETLLTTIESYSSGGLPIDPDDSTLLILPLFHIYGLNALMGSFVYCGAKMVMQAIPNPASMLNAIEQNELTSFAGVPAMYNMMYREYVDKPDEYDVSSLEYAVCAAAPLAEDTRRKIQRDWNVELVEGWGMTETGPAGTAEPVRGIKKEAGCIGLPVDGLEVKLVDPETRETRVAPEDLEPRGMMEGSLDYDDEAQVTGEIAVRGPQIFEGYHKLPEKNQEVFDEDGWFYTEDIARVDSDGYFWMVDRADDMIIAGGENIYPAEVENALYEHPDVAEAAVVAAPHEIKGQAPVAFVVLEEDAELSEDELRKFSLDHVASYAHPRRIFFVDELPRSATQKVQRYKLEEEAEERVGTLESSEEL
ncbi:MAG: class I adenylate-forming enzyme family protein [Halobacteriota archaeon]